MKIKNRINLIKGYDLILLKNSKDFEVKIIDNFTCETLIIDNSFMNKKALKLVEYIPLCKNLVTKLVNGLRLSQLSMQ